MKFERENFAEVFEIKEKLGHGHFAEVKRCIDKIQKTEYAAKFIRLRDILDPKTSGMSTEDIEREAHILQILDHQNIIKLHFCYDLGKSVALVLELVSGGELFDYISDSERLSEEEASQFVEQILLGVKHMHERKVIHLDLKPENVMIEDLEERKIKLIDFGLAREVKSKNMLIEMQGTAEFLAPEVINYDPISYATDMWSIGVITYIMLTGVSPFSGDDQSSTFQNIVNCNLEFDDDVCGDMTDVAKSFITSLLMPNASRRSTAAECLNHQWIKPMEPAIVVRRRSSIISKEKLQSLKNYVVYPSPPSSKTTTPRFSRRIIEKNFLLEDPEESCNDNDFIELNSVTVLDGVKVDGLLNNSTEPVEDNGLMNDNFIPITDNIVSNETAIENDTNPSSDKFVDNCQSHEPVMSSKIINGTDGINEKNAAKILNSFLSENCKTTKQSNMNVNNSTGSTANSLVNSVKKLNSKLENFSSFFDSKISKNSSLSPDCRVKRRGSLKNLLSINVGFVSGGNKSNPNSTVVSPMNKFNVNNILNSNNQKSMMKFNSKPVSASAATSPTVLKKSVFFSRYMDAIQGKKK